MRENIMPAFKTIVKNDVENNLVVGKPGLLEFRELQRDRKSASSI
jgi:hypothetical protein